MSNDIPSILDDRSDDESFYEKLELVRKVHRDAGERIRRRYADREPRKLEWVTENVLQD